MSGTATAVGFRDLADQPVDLLGEDSPKPSTGLSSKSAEVDPPIDGDGSEASPMWVPLKAGEGGDVALRVFKGNRVERGSGEAYGVDGVAIAPTLPAATIADPGLAEKSDCPSCGKRIIAGGRVCTSCWYDIDEGRRRESAPYKHGPNGTRLCGKCGYCIDGLPTQVCPECGTAFRRSFYRDWLQEESARLAMFSWMVPLAVGVGGVGLTFVLVGFWQLIAGGFWVFDWVLAAKYLGSVAAALVVIQFLVITAEVIYLGSEDPLWKGSLRVLAVIGVVDVLTFGLLLVLPTTIVVYPLFIAIMFIAVHYLMEWDLQDSAIAAFVFTAARFVCAWLVNYYF